MADGIVVEKDMGCMECYIYISAILLVFIVGLLWKSWEVLGESEGHLHKQVRVLCSFEYGQAGH